MSGPTCRLAKPWGAHLTSGAVAVTAPRRAYGSTVGRVLTKVAASKPAGTLGKNLCGFGPYPPLVAEPPALRSFSIRVHNENEALDDAHQITVTGPGGFVQVFDWDGGELNNTTYGPFTGEPGEYTVTGVMTEEHFNGNFFLTEVTDNDTAEIIYSAYVETAGFTFPITLLPL